MLAEHRGRRAAAAARHLLLLTVLLVAGPLYAAPVQPQLSLPRAGIDAESLAVVINENDPLSVAVGTLYASERAIPPAQVIRLRFPATATALDEATFRPLQKQLYQRLPDGVQGLLLTWLKPYRVDCMSITSAFAFGFDRKHCAVKAPDKPCGITPPSPYFASNSEQPYTDLNLRPTMLLGAGSLAEARALIRRGLESERGVGQGSAWLPSTSDRARNIRSAGHEAVRKVFSRWLPVHTPASDTVQNQSDIMFYFTGLARVGGIDSNTYLPGAVADHLTSFGGMLTDSSQMSALAWIRAGATGSYGTVREPCAVREKFPDPGLMMQHYLAGERLLEAYWKSVAWPAEGIFLGDPLARPYKGYFVRHAGSGQQFDIPWLAAGHYALEGASAAFGPFRPLLKLSSRGGSVLLPVPVPVQTHYRLVRLSSAH